ncbi:hypothetical protein [Sphaerimonospora mesophila]|uniref:hypothetical protein n=1 Tax=Sphaerimonospora mesophila TaxID=37483 RepID=UPI0006E2B088
MTGSEIKIGTIVDITIKGVRVLARHSDGAVVVKCDDDKGGWAMPPQAAITPVAPAEFPPQLGDLWRDRDGDLWFAITAYDMDGDAYVAFCSPQRKSVDDWGEHGVYHVAEHYGPLALVHREDGEGQ